MTLRLDEDHARKLNELAQRVGTSKHEAVLHAIDEEFNRMTHRQRVTDALNHTVERWGGRTGATRAVTPCEFLSLEDLLDIVSARRYIGIDSYAPMKRELRANRGRSRTPR